MGYASIAIESSRSAGEMALNIAKKLPASSIDDLSMLIHASVHDQGMGVFWNPACALQDTLGCPASIGLALRQGCDGLLMAMQLAHEHLNYKGKGQALIVGSDRFSGSGFCRITADYSILYGDAAAAVVIGHNPGLAKILSIETVADPGLSSLHNGIDLNSYDVRSAKKRYLEQHGKERLRDATRNALKKIKNRIFNSKLHQETVDYILLPHLGMDILKENYFPTLTTFATQIFSEFGTKVGHLGTSDQIASFAELLRRNTLKSGDRILLIGAGSGFCWTGILLEIC
jgi:3-oxoacyl-[acyl-carrier-protein] synthase-3